MKILVINAGSSSLKFQLFNMEDESVIAKGNCEKIGLEGSFIGYKTTGDKKEVLVSLPDHNAAIAKVFEVLTDEKEGVIKSVDEISAVGHRYVQGGWLFDKSVLINDKVIEELTPLMELSPLHSKANIAGIKACIEAMPNTPQVAVFDTAFHATMPAKAYMYGIKYEDYEKYHVRKYGFHGTSHRYVTSEVAKILNKDVDEVNVITVHVGNGSSITAVKNGKSIDTTMGLTPLEGLIMGTRSGDIDPGAFDYLADKKGLSSSDTLKYLNKECGILGVSGVSSDMRELNTAIDEGNERAKLALDMLVYKVKKYIGSYLAALGKTDAIVFTGGIGENQENLRSGALEDMQNLGIEIDVEKNDHLPRGTAEEISTANSKVRVFRIPTDEEKLIARDTKAIVEKL
ncbi:MAG: acetate kinase [Clostridia bacterium]|jgi:acetate kinase|nr:acetate kinase [Clostridia bacterium]